MITNDGGQAFPLPAVRIEFSSGEVEYHECHAGMSLRDYFAGQAFALGGEWFHNSGSTNVAETAYEIADAMLKAREG
jgi:methylmalonyl-CoA mutase N-terminal domain/subunit